MAAPLAATGVSQRRRSARPQSETALHRYRLCGLVLGSRRRLPGLVPEHGASRVDVLVDLRPGAKRGSPLRGAALWRAHPLRDARGRAVVEVRRDAARRRFAMRYLDGAEFTVDEAGRSVRGRWPAGQSVDDAMAYLAGPVFGFVLRLRGSLALHASAVVVGDRAVLLAGASGAGKSTLAAALALRGVPVLCDDAAALSEGTGGCDVHPGSPRVRLWPEAANLLLPPGTKLPRLAAGWEKRYLDLRELAGAFGDRPRRLGAIYVLDSRPRATAAHSVPLAPRDALVALVTHAYVGHLQDAPMRAREFALLARIAERVPVRRLTHPQRPGMLDALCAHLLDEAARAVPAAAGGGA
jgi:hypothetical protein